MIISNSTPLIAFARIGELPLLKTIVERLVIPTAVAREISEYGPERLGYIDLSQESWISTQAVQSEQQVRLLLPTLDRGEANVIFFARPTDSRLSVTKKLDETLFLFFMNTRCIHCRVTNRKKNYVQ